MCLRDFQAIRVFLLVPVGSGRSPASPSVVIGTVVSDHRLLTKATYRFLRMDSLSHRILHCYPRSPLVVNADIDMTHFQRP